MHSWPWGVPGSVKRPFLSGVKVSKFHVAWSLLAIAYKYSLPSRELIYPPLKVDGKMSFLFLFGGICWFAGGKKIWISASATLQTASFWKACLPSEKHCPSTSVKTKPKEWVRFIGIIKKHPWNFGQQVFFFFFGGVFMFSCWWMQATKSYRLSLSLSIYLYLYIYIFKKRANLFKWK